MNAWAIERVGHVTPDHWGVIVRALGTRLRQVHEDAARDFRSTHVFQHKELCEALMNALAVLDAEASAPSRDSMGKEGRTFTAERKYGAACLDAAVKAARRDHRFIE